MKLIALLPAKDEEWILPAFISSVKPVVDEIVAVDNGSSDSTPELLEAAGAYVEVNAVESGTSWAENLIRQQLLEIGRSRGGTHFLCLDADEALTSPSARSLRGAAERLEPAQKLAMQWLALWKDHRAYRVDRGSVWSNNFKDFLFRDSPELTFLARGDDRGWGTLRTPGKNDSTDWLRMPVESAAVAHFQFVPWDRVQAKQAWYRCCELVARPHSAVAINAMYEPSLDDPEARLEPIPDRWLSEVDVPVGIEDMPVAWHLDAIYKMFDEMGSRFFEPLQIWHISQLRERFVRETGREPKAKNPTTFALFGEALRGKVRR